MVIVPGFGAFISEYISAIVDETSGEIKPPSSKLIFDTKIKNNDGLLVGQVAEATRCTHFEALQKIEKERDNIIYQLDKGEKVELDEIGILLYNAEKQIVLVSDEDAYLTLANYGLEIMQINESVETETEEPDSNPVPVVEEIPEEPIEEVVVEKEESVTEEPSVLIEETEVIDKKDETITKEIVAESIYASFEKKEKRKGGWVWLLVILIPLLAVSVFIYMKQNKPVEPVKIVQQPQINTVTQDTTPQEETAIVDSIASQTADTLFVEKEPVQEKQVEIVSGKYYLVGGSFKEEENAETFLQTLKEKGFKPFHMGKYGNFFIVGIGSYNTENEAIVAKDEYLEQNPGSGVWILKR